MVDFNFNVVNYGIFDSSVKFPDVTLSKNRVVGFFEFELFVSDQEHYSYVNESKIKQEKGTLICAKPGQVRYSELPFYCLYLHISSDDDEFIRLMNALPDSLKADDISLTTELFKSLMKDEGDTPADHLAIKGNACRLLSHILKLSYRSNTVYNPALNTYRKALINVANYIEHHLSEKLSIKALAKVANLSPTYFHRLFSEKFGQTPNEYIYEHRITAAKAALLSDRVTVADVAADCGFSSQSYFNHKFKEATGQTPLEYREHMLSRLKL